MVFIYIEWCPFKLNLLTHKLTAVPVRKVRRGSSTPLSPLSLLLRPGTELRQLWNNLRTRPIRDFPLTFITDKLWPLANKYEIRHDQSKVHFYGAVYTSLDEFLILFEFDSEE